jgi:DNA-binding CsgD family transcriptional regulator
MSLLERDTLLAQLTTEWTSASAGAGRLVFVEGEAGIGKTSLLRAFARSLDGHAPVLSGACEGLRTPRPLGPLHDIAAQAGDPLRALLDEGVDRHRVFVAFVELLRERPALVLLEDLHWADDATLDLLRYAGRRIERTRSMLVGSYRTDELVPAHPLRAVLGDLATTGPLHLAPQALSPQAVHTLCSGFDVDAREVHRRTGGNPFFVTEVLAAPAAQVPTTVQDAVLARAGRLSASARAVLDAAAIAGPRVEPVVLQALVAAESAAIEEGLATGVLCVDGGAITFRHELARQAVLGAMTPTRAMSLHRMTQSALRANAVPHALTRLAHHAEGSGDAEAVRKWAPLAAREAAARGAHMQAAHHWARTLAHTEGEAARAQVLDPYADELRACGMVEPAIAAKAQAAVTWRALGREREGIASFTDLAKMQLLVSRDDFARDALHAARALLPPDADALERSRVDICEADVRRQTLDYRAAAALARSVLAHAEHRGDRALQLEALNTLGSSLVHCGNPDEGIALLHRSLALAESSGADLWGAMTLSLLALSCTALLRLDAAEGYLERGGHWCAERDLDAPRLMQTTMRAGLHLLRGRWNEAGAAADEVIGNPRAMPIALVRAYTVLGRLRARQGDAQAREAFAAALRLGRGSLGSVVTTHVSQAELAWLEGRDDDAAREASAGLALARDIEHRGLAVELRMWLRLSGRGEAAANAADDHPCALQAAGRWQEAASRWRTFGCPYETARALSQGDERAQREALTIAESLGARPLAQRLRRRLRVAGVRDLPRGPRATTLRHPAGLTSREVAVLALLAAGLRNKEIALRLSRSPRTIDHHLESIFGKLDVATRAEAVSAAFRLGVVDAGTGMP